MEKQRSKIIEVIAYAFFGVCTTIVNILVFHVCTQVIGLFYMLSNVIAWVISVSFAFVTNKKYVFGSEDRSKETWFKEATKFFEARIMTGLLDMVLMYVLISLLTVEQNISKIIVNIIVIVANYIFSRFWIFSTDGKKM